MVYVSVIIPVHNGEKHLAETLDTVRNQTLTDIEVICVDDGSTDGSADILRRYCEIDSRISMIQQPNQGAASARNAGLETATGKYLYFFDADDLLYPNALKNTTDAADKFKADLVLAKYQRMNTLTGHVSKSVRHNLPAMKFDRTNDKSQEGKLFQLTSPSVSDKLFLREFIIEIGIKFQEIPRTEDLFFAWAALASANRIVLLDEALFKYRIFQTGNQQSGLTRTPLTIAQAIREAYDFLVERGLYTKEIERSFLNVAVTHFSHNLVVMTTGDSYEQLYEVGRNELFNDLKMFDFPIEYFYNPESAIFVEHMAKNQDCREFAMVRSGHILKESVLLSNEVVSAQRELRPLDQDWRRLWRSPAFLLDSGLKYVSETGLRQVARKVMGK